MVCELEPKVAHVASQAGQSGLRVAPRFVGMLQDSYCETMTQVMNARWSPPIVEDTSVATDLIPIEPQASRGERAADLV